MEADFRIIVLRAIASPNFVFRFDPIDYYWATIATSTKLWVRDALEHVGDGRIAPCIFSLLATRWAGEPVKLLKITCRVLVSNLIFSAILMSAGAYRGRIRNSDDVKNVADNFEAYVAAYARQFGTRRLKLWVFRAFGPLVDSIRSACIAAFSVLRPNAYTQLARIKDIDTALARLAVAITTGLQPVKRKGSDEDEDAPASKKARLQSVLGDRTNGQGKSRTRSKQPPSDAPPALLQRMTDPPPPPHADSTPALLRRMQPPSSFADYRLVHQYTFTMTQQLPAVASWYPLMPWWTASAVFASAMEDIGVPLAPSAVYGYDFDPYM